MLDTLNSNESLNPLLNSNIASIKNKRSNTLTSISSNIKIKKSVTFAEYDTVITPKLVAFNNSADDYSGNESSDLEGECGDHERYELTEHGEVVLVKRNNNSKNSNVKNGHRFSIGSIKDTIFNRARNGSYGKHRHRHKNNTSVKKGTFNFKNVIFKIDHKITDPNSLVRINKTWKVFPFHLFPLLKYAFINTDYNLNKSLYFLLPCQIIYLLLQIIPNTNYGYISVHKEPNTANYNISDEHKSSSHINRKKKTKTMKPNIIILAQCIILIPIVSLLLTFFIIICGGPLNSFKDTFYLACHINSINLPMGYTLINCNFKQVNLKKFYITVLLGAWLGCFAIPLDWDREWQRWPISLVVGAYIGGIVAYGLGIYM
ncbi:hypothetical protein QEN19_001254 [Hanseniaspora menglaensis]